MFNIYLQNSRTLRRSFLQILKETIYLCFRPLCKNLHIRPFVADASVNAIFNRMPAHCRTKANALHNAVNTNLSCLCLIHRHAPPSCSFFIYSELPLHFILLGQLSTASISLKPQNDESRQTVPQTSEALPSYNYLQ